MAFTQINNLTIHYQVEGSAGSPALVFVNSLGSDWRIWDEVVPHFSGRFFVIRYDKRGHGLSDCPPGPYTIGTLADDLAGLLDDLGVNTAVPIGISVGGMIALAFAARYPPRVPKLVLSNTGAVIGTAVYWAERIAALKANGFPPLIVVTAICSGAPRWPGTSPPAPPSVMLICATLPVLSRYPRWFCAARKMRLRRRS
jgi:pimeloyl-ACP methyl ester carboxylesterase